MDVADTSSICGLRGRQARKADAHVDARVPDRAAARFRVSALTLIEPETGVPYFERADTGQASSSEWTGVCRASGAGGNPAAGWAGSDVDCDEAQGLAGGAPNHAAADRRVQHAVQGRNREGAAIARREVAG